MSTFLEKNKKKSALALLLLFLRRRKTLTALLLLVAIASFLFVSPSNILLNLPGGARAAAAVAWAAGKIGVDTSRWGLSGGKHDYGDLLAAFRAAKDGGGKAGWSAFMGGQGAGAGTGSLDFVKGSRKDLEASGGSGANLPKPGSIGGVLNSDDAKNQGAGVALSEDDLTGERAGLVKSAPGGKLGDVVKGGLDGIKAPTGKGVEIKGGAKGRLSAARAATIGARTAKGRVGTHTINGQRAFVQLAAQRGRSAISVAPNCTASSGCPGEFAATNTGAVYDGNMITGDRTDILTFPEIDGASGPNLPDTGMADDYVAQAEKMEADAKKCRELDDKYGPQELEYDKQQEAVSRKFDAMGCGKGGCKSKKACMALGEEMKAICRASMGVRCQHIRECPLTANNNCSAAECDGPARNKVKVTEDNGTAEGTGQNIRTTTFDQLEESAGCLDAKQEVANARQAARNALDEYRGQDCEALYSSPLLTDKLKYLSTCSGRESQVVNTCKNYANALCSRVHACSEETCASVTNECVITDLSGIEEFILATAKY